LTNIQIRIILTKESSNQEQKERNAMTSEAIRKILMEKGLKVTPQRMVIADYLIHEKTHPTADDVFEAVKSRLPACSRATVYNTLNTLVDAGVVSAIATEPGKTRYDANMHPHHHFIDTRTGAIHDIPWEQVSQLCESLGSAFKIQDYQITFFGEYQPKS
jgi:Fur family peroxide stress response transcriptional regulator